MTKNEDFASKTPDYTPPKLTEPNWHRLSCLKFDSGRAYVKDTCCQLVVAANRVARLDTGKNERAWRLNTKHLYEWCKEFVAQVEA